MQRPKPMLSIGALAARTGLAVSAIRFYEEKGLVRSERNAGGQRRFHRAEIRRLSLLIIAQRFGFSLDEIARYFDTLPQDRPPNESDWQRLAVAMRDALDARIATLERMRDTLDGCIGCGCLSMQRCALYNPGDGAAKLGAGARYLMGDSSAAVTG